MSYSSMQAPIFADDDEMFRLFEQLFGGPAVASNTGVSDPSLEQTAIGTENHADLFGYDADASHTVEPVNEVEARENHTNDTNQNVDVVKEQIVITLPAQDAQSVNDDDNVLHLQNIQNIHTDNSTFSSSGEIGINYQFPTSGSGSVNYQTAMHGNVNSGINYEFPTSGSGSVNYQTPMHGNENADINHEFPTSGSDSSVNYYNYYNFQTTMNENVSQEADSQGDAMGFDMIRYALEPNDSTSYMGNYYFPNDENVVGDVDSSLSFPTSTQSTHPVTEGSDFGGTGVVQNNDNNFAVIGDHDPTPITDDETLAVGDEDNFFSFSFPTPTHSNYPVAEGSGLETNSDVQNNDNNNTVVGDNSQLPVTYNNNLALPQAPTNVQGSGGFFILPYYDPSTGQISHVPFPIPIPNPAAEDHYPTPITNDNNLAVPDQTQAVGDGEHHEDDDNSSLCFPSPIPSNHPVVEGSGLENNGDVENNDNNQNAVVGDSDHIPVTNSNDLALPQAPANTQGSGGFFLLPYYDPSTGQTSQVPFPVSALQGMGQSDHFPPNQHQPNGSSVANGSFNASMQQPEFVQGNSRGGAIPTPMGQADYTKPTMDFGASEMSGGDPILNITNVPPVNLDWNQPIFSSSFHVSPIIGSKRQRNGDANTHETISRPRKCRYRGQVKNPAYPHPHSLEERRSAPPYVKIGHKHVYLCNYLGPAEVNESRICGEPLMTGVRNCKRHVAKHAEREEKMIQAGVLRLEEAHALFWAEKIQVQCAHCNHNELVWRTDGVRAKHEAEFHPEIFANRPKVIRKKKGKEKGEGTGKSKEKGKGKGKGKGKEREEGINDENA